MNTDSDVVSESPVAAQAAAAPHLPAARLLYWSMRREVWENRSLYVAPLIVAAVVLFGTSIRAAFTLPGRVRSLPTLDAAKQQTALAGTYSMAASMIIVATIIVAVFYCLDALYGERRDRSILFWKSLPVSDLLTVLSKAAIPLVVLPVLAYGIGVATQALMLVQNTIVLGMNGLGAETLWARVPLVRMSLVLLYGLIVHVLWHAPLYGWLLLVSAWARRVPILWAVLPPLALGLFERITFGTTYFGRLVRYRVMGPLTEAFDFEARGGIIPVLEPLRFLTSMGLWSGLLFAAGFLVAAARLRRYRDPI